MLSKNVAKLSGCNMGHAVAARLFLPRGVPSIRAKALSRTKISSAVPSTAFFASEVEDQDSGNLTLNHISVEDRFHQPSIRPSTSTMISMRSDRPCTNSHLQYVCILMIIGCDFHPSWQQVSWLDTETGETGEQKLVQASGDAERFYRQVAAPALIGMEATGNCHWLVDLLSELGHELWVGDAAQIRASYVRQQKTDQRAEAHVLKLLVEVRFPRIWMPSSEVRDLRQLLLHRYKLVIIRARVKNELQHLCLNKGVQRKRKLWSQAGQQILRELPLKPWAGRRRDDLLKLMAMLDQQS